MEKNRILGLAYYSFVILLIAGTFQGCTLPMRIALEDPLTPQEHINLGVSYEHYGDFKAALLEYDLASKHIPIAHLYMGNAFFQQMNYDEAEKQYKTAIEKTDSPRAYNNLAWLYYTTDKNLDEAETLARKAVDFEPENAEFIDTLEKINEKKGQIPKM